jgi:hypothetical protein
MIVTIDASQLTNTDVRTKMLFLGKALQDFHDWIVKHQNDLYFRPDPVTTINSNQMLDRLKDVLTKSAATISGYHKELELASKHIGKVRTIHFGNRGDVAIDYETPGYGKAIQAKSCFSSNYADVDEHIKKAALQLTGEKVKEETPGSNDRRIVDISIRNADNTWPRTDKQTPSMENILERIKKYVTEYTAGKKGYNFDLLQKNDTRDAFSLSSRTLRAISRTGEVDFIVKIRWDTPRWVWIDNSCCREIGSVTVRIEKVENGSPPKYIASLVRYQYARELSGAGSKLDLR